MDVGEVQKKALLAIEELLKKKPECISLVEKTKDGWIVNCEVLERKAVPENFDLLKVFEFKLDNQAKVIGYRQIRKIKRGDKDDGDKSTY